MGVGVIWPVLEGWVRWSTRVGEAARQFSSPLEALPKGSPTESPIARHEFTAERASGYGLIHRPTAPKGDALKLRPHEVLKPTKLTALGNIMEIR